MNNCYDRTAMVNVGLKVCMCKWLRCYTAVSHKYIVCLKCLCKKFGSRCAAFIQKSMSLEKVWVHAFVSPAFL